MIKRSGPVAWILKILAVLIMVFWTLTPIYIVVTNAFRRTLDIKKMPPDLIFKPVLMHFERLLALDDFLRYFFNSVMIAGLTTVVAISFGTLAAYGLKLFRSRLGERLSNLLLLGKLVPAIAVLLPLFTIMNRLSLTGTYFGPVIAHAAMGLPFVTWIMACFVRDLPDELLESATIDGCSRMGTFFSIVFPMLKPAIASATILIMQFSWNELLFSLQLTKLDTYPLTVGIARYVGAVSVDWGKSSAAATIALVPIIVVGFILQKYLVTGMTAGAIKG
jgi:multiple sugar transport system permease protein